MPYERVSFWEPQSQVTQEQLHKIARNQDFANQLKAEGRVRNVNSEGVARKSGSPFKMNDIAVLSTREEITARLDNLSPNKLRLSYSYSFPSNDKGNYFDNDYLPIVTASITNTKNKKLAVVLRSITPTAVKMIVQSFGDEFNPGNDSLTINILAVGVKGRLWS